MPDLPYKPSLIVKTDKRGRKTYRVKNLSPAQMRANRRVGANARRASRGLPPLPEPQLGLQGDQNHPAAMGPPESQPGVFDGKAGKQGGSDAEILSQILQSINRGNADAQRRHGEMIQALSQITKAIQAAAGQQVQSGQATVAGMQSSIPSQRMIRSG